MGEQRKATVPRRCTHPCPIEVSGTGAGKKRARCLSCGAIGPERADAAGAVRALRDQATRRATAVT